MKYPVGKVNISYAPVVATSVNIIGDAKETDPVPTPECHGVKSMIWSGGRMGFRIGSEY